MCCEKCDILNSNDAVYQKIIVLLFLVFFIVMVTACSSDGNKPTTGETQEVLEIIEDIIELQEGEESSIAFECSPESERCNVVWSSSDENIVAVDEYGSVEAIGIGEATITVSMPDKDLTDSITITVSGKYYTVDNLPTGQFIKRGDKFYEFLTMDNKNEFVTSYFYDTTIRNLVIDFDENKINILQSGDQLVSVSSQGDLPVSFKLIKVQIPETYVSDIKLGAKDRINNTKLVISWKDFHNDKNMHGDYDVQEINGSSDFTGLTFQESGDELDVTNSYLLEGEKGENFTVSVNKGTKGLETRTFTISSKIITLQSPHNDINDFPYSNSDEGYVYYDVQNLKTGYYVYPRSYELCIVQVK